MPASANKYKEGVDADWRKDDGMQKYSKYGGIVDFVDGHIDGYDMAAVLRMGFFRVRAPVFADPFVMKQTLAVFAMVWLWAGFFMAMDKSKIMTVDGVLVGQAAGIFGYFGGLTGFLFGFFIFSSLGAFMTLKNAYLGGYWGAFQDIMALTGLWFPETDEKTQKFKLTIVRWGLALFGLVCGTCDPDMSSDEMHASLVLRGLLTKEESDAIVKSGNNNGPLVLMLAVFEENCKGLRADGWKVDKIENKCMYMRACLGGVVCGATSWGQTPLPLVHLMSALVKIQLFLLSVKEGVSIADIVLGETSGKTTQVICSLLMAVSTPIIFQGLLEFVIMISNPFGSDQVDFPTHLFHSQIRDEMLQFIQIGEIASQVPRLNKVPSLNGGR